MTIESFKNNETEDIHYGRVTRNTLRLLPQELHHKAQVKLARLSAASKLHDLQTLPGNRFEALKGDRKGQYSIRVNDKYRICFKWAGADASFVEIVDYHS
jgi:proteic killer suppression protein